MITIDDFKANTKEWLIDKLESLSQEEALQIISDLYNELHRPKYPKTYVECCGIMGFCSASLDWNNPFCVNRDTHSYIKHLDILMESFYKLLICRDAYWKIAGDQMGLGKPWEPDFTNDDEERYGMYTTANKVVKDFCGVGDVNTILTFPTEEMRDTFYENFKDLIEQCKELL